MIYNAHDSGALNYKTIRAFEKDSYLTYFKCIRIPRFKNNKKINTIHTFGELIFTSQVMKISQGIQVQVKVQDGL